MKDLETKGFVTPHPIKELGGELGLYSFEIADSLGLQRHCHLIEKCERLGIVERFAKHGWAITACTVNAARSADGGGRPFKGALAFSLDAAKAFVAKWDNEIGMAYLKHLLSCEKVVEKIVALPPSSQTDTVIALLTQLIARHDDRIAGQGLRVDAVVADVKTIEAEVRLVKESVSLEAIDEKVQASLKRLPASAPSTYITFDDIAEKFFPGASVAKVRAMICQYGHPRDKVAILVSDGEVREPLMCKREGIEEACMEVIESIKYRGKSELSYRFSSRFLRAKKGKDAPTFLIRIAAVEHDADVRSVWLPKIGDAPLFEKVDLRVIKSGTFMEKKKRV